MLAGRGKPKGNKWELDLGRDFSLWLSEGKRSDLFVRNVTSGGAFTAAINRGKSQGVPGDLMAADPLAHEFLSIFMVEAKHWKNLDIINVLWKKSELTKELNKARKQALASRRHLLFVAKQNYRPALLFMEHAIGEYLFGSEQLVYHSLWNREIFMCLLEDVLVLKPVEVRYVVRPPAIVRRRIPLAVS